MKGFNDFFSLFGFWVAVTGDVMSQLAFVYSCNSGQSRTTQDLKITNKKNNFQKKTLL